MASEWADSPGKQQNEMAGKTAAGNESVEKRWNELIPDTPKARANTASPRWEIYLIFRRLGVGRTVSVATLGGWGAVGSKVGVLTIRPTLLTSPELVALASPNCGHIAKSL